MAAKSPAEFVRNYRIDSTGTYAERTCEFLNEGARAIPYRFIDKRAVAKIAFGLSKTPSEDSDYVKNRLPSVLNSAARLLKKKYNRDIYIDILDGVRATVDDADLVRTKHRRKRRRVRSAIASLQETDAMIDQNKLDGDLKKEVLRSRRSLRLLTEAVKELPLLPPAKGKNEPSVD